MDLLLKVIDGPSDASWRGLEAHFDPSGGLIGRAETARLSLPDSSRTVSRFHAHVSCSGETYFLEEMGSQNVATVNGKALKAGNKEPLRPGDKLKIGRFTIAVEFDDPDFPATQVIDPSDMPAGLADLDDSDSTRIVVREGRGMRSSNPNSDLLEALQDGVGVRLDLPLGLHPEFMRSLGLMLRTLIGGIHRLTTQRVRLREEAAPDQARPQSRHINPIRAAAEESRLVGTVLKPGGEPPPHARIQAMVEELSAQMAAMRTAVSTAVEQTEARLAPSAVEERLPVSLLLDELLPMRRKARLWDLYLRTHGALMAERTDSQRDGQADAKSGGKDGKAGVGSGVRELFNRAFTRAYEAEVARLRKDRH